MAHITEINVFDIQKRYKPTKHYVYSIWVFWSDKREQLIFRRYSQFFDLQCKLLDRFKKEAGIFDPQKRELPFLPGKIIFGRSHIKSVALDRLHPINVYCKKLITLKNEISRCDLVIQFFELNNLDIVQSSNHKLDRKYDEPKVSPTSISKPFKAEEYVCVHNYKPLSRTELSIKKNTKVSVVEKNLNGWWFVDSSEGQGYVPKCILKPVGFKDDDSPVKTEVEKYIATRDYAAKKPDELDFRKGDYLDVYEKNFNGWWKARLYNKSGMVPAVFLQKFFGADPVSSAVSAWDLFGSSPSEDSAQSSNPPPRSECTTANPDHSDLDSINSSSPNSINFNDTQSLSSFRLPFKQVDDVYYVVENFADNEGDCVNLTRGERVYVLDKENSSGWWFVKTDQSVQGWAPSAFLTVNSLSSRLDECYVCVVDKKLIFLIKKEKPEKPARPPRPTATLTQSNNASLNLSDNVSNTVPNNVSNSDDKISLNNAGPMFKLVNDKIVNICSKEQNNSLQRTLVNNLKPVIDTQVKIDNDQNSTADYRPVKVSEMRKLFDKK